MYVQSWIHTAMEEQMSDDAKGIIAVVVCIGIIIVLIIRRIIRNLGDD